MGMHGDILIMSSGSFSILVTTAAAAAETTRAEAILHIITNDSIIITRKGKDNGGATKIGIARR